MTLIAHSLASGSSGNSILVRDSETTILIDAGIGIRRLIAALAVARVNPSDLSAILISHEHSDHTAGAVRMALRFGVPLVSNSKTLAAISMAGSVPYKVLEVGEELAVGRLAVRSFPISHDAVQPVGYTVAGSGGTICCATDTGKLTPEMYAEVKSADLLILESNHDVNMLVRGPYPWYLKQRIMGDKGHLSNETASKLLLELAESGKASSVWLAHLSRTNNSPSLALATAKKLLQACVGSALNVSVALRDVPSLVWQQESSA